MNRKTKKKKPPYNPHAVASEVEYAARQLRNVSFLIKANHRESAILDLVVGIARIMDRLSEELTVAAKKIRKAT